MKVHFFIENLRSLEFYSIPLLIDEDLELSMKKFLKVKVYFSSFSISSQSLDMLNI